MSESRNIYDRALEFGIFHYADRLRKDKHNPILLHALRVVEIARRKANITDDRILAAAFLHDVLEDTLATEDELVKSVGPEVSKLVVLLTEDRRMPKSERKARMLNEFPSLPRDAKLIKLADRLDNIRSSWLVKSQVKHRYLRECREILHWSKGVNPPLESLLAQAIKNLEVGVQERLREI